MTASERSLLGFAKQSAKGTINSTDNAFDYILFSRGQAGVQNMVVPLDPEVGGGAVLRDVVKVGVTSGGALEFIPRPASLGHFLMAMTGLDTPTGVAPAAVEHAFKLPTDQFTAPYYTVRMAPGNLWGESYQDCRFTSLALNWRGANFVRGAVSFIGGLPTSGLNTGAWAPSVDGTPPFVTPVSVIQLPTSTNIKVLAGSFQATSAIPMDQQWIVGSYSPDDFDIVSRAYVLQLTLKVTDATLYNKMMYDGAGTASWTAAMLREGDFDITFKSAQNMGTTPDAPYSLKIAANGTAAQDGNVAWTAQPLGLRAGQQVIMSVTGVFLADATKAIEMTLTNQEATAY